MHSSSLPAMKWATPLTWLWVVAPPRASMFTSSPVTALITCGPVINIWLVLATIMIKSVRAGEYTAPPAQGPIITEICGITPEAMVLRKKISP